MSARVELRRGSYRDSVTLMQMSEAVSSGGGVDAAIVAMATPLNIELYERLGFDPADVADAGANDLLVAIRAADDAALDAAVAQLEALLVARAAPDTKGFGAAPPARTVANGTAQRRVPGADLGARRARVRRGDGRGQRRRLGDAVLRQRAGRPGDRAQDEAAATSGSLVMGPDCGTAVVGGLGLGFANALRPGPVGIVAASGTGAQQVSCLLDAAGVGVSAVLGVGGRDLSAAVGRPIDARGHAAAGPASGHRTRRRAVQAAGRTRWPSRCVWRPRRSTTPSLVAFVGSWPGGPHRDHGESPCGAGH